MSEKKIQTQTPRVGAMFGRGGGPIRGAVEKPKDFWGTLKRLVRYLRPQLPKLILVMIFAVASTIFMVYGPRISGNAINEITNGFIAQKLVSGISEAQKKALPPLKDMLKKMQEGEDAAVAQAKAMVKAQFEKQISAMKERAYVQAEAEVKRMFVKNPPKELIEAEKRVESEVRKQFNAKIAQMKEQAYAQAEAKAVEQIKKNPPPELIEAKEQAIAKAKEEVKRRVDAQFRTLFPGVPPESIPGYKETLEAIQEKVIETVKAQVDATATKKAKAQARMAVDAEFKKKQPEFEERLAKAIEQAKSQVEKAALEKAIMQAKAAVDTEFAKRQPEFERRLAEAENKAVIQAKETVRKKILEKANLTEEQLDGIKEFAELPVVNTISDYSKRAETVKRIIDLSKNLPLDKVSSFMSSGTSSKAPKMKNFSFSETDLQPALDIIRRNGGKIPFDSLGRILLLLIALYVFSSLLTFIVQYIMSDVAQKTTYSLRRDLFEKFMRLPIRYYDTHSTGDILSRMSNDLDTVSTTLQQSITQIITSITQLVGFLIMMLTISGKLTVIAVLSLPVYSIVMMLIIKFSQKFFLEQQTHLGSLSGHAEEMYTGHIIVKTYNREKDSIERFERINNDLYNASWRAQFFTGIMMPSTNFISNVAYVFTAVFGGILVTRNLLNLGDIVAFIQYLRSFSQPIVQIANISETLQSTMACAERVFNVLDEEEEIPDPADAVTLVNPRGEIVFDNVDFSYVEEKPLFEDLNLIAKPGEMIAIVGPTGAGKTTLVNLLMRFYEIKDGVIWFDGIDTRKIRRGDLRTKIGMVLQDTWLFNGTIKENIAYGKDGATDQEIIEAAKLAHADRFIRSLPQGYDTVINEEASNISAGEEQLLTIARAFLVNPTVLILDEATSNVDTRTEKLIQRALQTLMRGRTSFVIAHRLSTIRDAKTILVMNNGKIIEQGSHEELLKKKGFYAELYYAQFVGAFDSEVIPNPEALKVEEEIS